MAQKTLKMGDDRRIEATLELGAHDLRVRLALPPKYAGQLAETARKPEPAYKDDEPRPWTWVTIPLSRDQAAALRDSIDQALEWI